MVEFVTPPSITDPTLFDEDDDYSQHRYRQVTDLLDTNASPPGLVERLLLTTAEEPSSVAEAKQDASWSKAMEEKLSSIEENATWELVELPRGHKPISLKWVYKVKRDELGAIVKHKARLVAKGYVQRARIDFEEVYAPVARLDSVRLLLAIAAQEE